MHEVFGAVLAGQALRRDRAESTPGYGSPALRGGGTAACGQDYRLSRADERSAQALWQGRWLGNISVNKGSTESPGYSSVRISWVESIRGVGNDSESSNDVTTVNVGVLSCVVYSLVCRDNWGTVLGLPVNGAGKDGRARSATVGRS